MTTSGVILGQVVNVRDHPRASKIWLADVRLGASGDTVQIVFGGLGKIVQPGSLVPVAPPGSRLPDPRKLNGRKMRRRSYRGEISHGMLCSLAELGWDDAVTNQVAIFKNGILAPGAALDAALDHVSDGWRSLVLPPVLADPAPFPPGLDGLDGLAGLVDSALTVMPTRPSPPVTAPAARAQDAPLTAASA